MKEGAELERSERGKVQVESELTRSIQLRVLLSLLQRVDSRRSEIC